MPRLRSSAALLLAVLDCRATLHCAKVPHFRRNALLAPCLRSSAALMLTTLDCWATLHRTKTTHFRGTELSEPCLHSTLHCFALSPDLSTLPCGVLHVPQPIPTLHHSNKISRPAFRGLSSLHCACALFCCCAALIRPGLHRATLSRTAHVPQPTPRGVTCRARGPG